MNAYIRSANERDLVLIQALLRKTWHATYDAIYGVERVTAITREWHSLNNLRTNLQRPFSEFIVAERADGIAGMAYASQTDPGFVVLGQLYVSPDLQGQGIGGELLAEIEAAFPDAPAIRLEVEGANLGAVLFYQKAGFARLGETKNCGTPTSGIPALIMQKQMR